MCVRNVLQYFLCVLFKACVFVEQNISGSRSRKRCEPHCLILVSEVKGRSRKWLNPMGIVSSLRQCRQRFHQFCSVLSCNLNIEVIGILGYPQDEKDGGIGKERRRSIHLQPSIFILR